MRRQVPTGDEINPDSSPVLHPANVLAPVLFNVLRSEAVAQLDDDREELGGKVAVVVDEAAVGRHQRDKVAVHGVASGRPCAAKVKRLRTRTQD